MASGARCLRLGRQRAVAVANQRRYRSPISAAPIREWHGAAGLVLLHLPREFSCRAQLRLDSLQPGFVAPLFAQGAREVADEINIFIDLEVILITNLKCGFRLSCTSA